MSLTKSLRNRLVGILVIVSLILIVIPFVTTNSDSQGEATRDPDAIAITKNGAVTDQNGRLVSASDTEHDYSDILNPVNDEPLATDNANNAQSPFDALDNNKLQSQNLEVATPTNDANTFEVATPTPVQESNNVVAASPATQVVTQKKAPVKTEVLKSSRNTTAQTHNTTRLNTTNNFNTQKTVAPTTSGKFAAQVGVFSDNSKVGPLVTKLKSLGFNAVRQNININGRAMIRVFAGYAKDRPSANALCNKVKAKGVECLVKSL